MKTGRPSKYETHVKPRFAEIKEWLKAGATDKEIALNLGINAKVLCKYKNQFSDLNELFKNGRISAVQDIKAALYKRATGFHYTERKKVTERMKLPKELKDFLDGVGIETDKLENPVLVRTEETEKYALPDPTSALILLKHWDKETEWTSDPATLRLKKEELELKKKHMQLTEW